MAVYGGRRAFQALYLNDVASGFAKERGHIIAHHASHFIIVASDESCVFARIGLPVEENHRYSLVVGTVYDIRNGVHLIWRDYEQVDAGIHQTVNLGYLPAVIVVCRDYFQLHVVIIIKALEHLSVEFITPVVLGALRHTDNVFLFVRST